MRKAEVAGIDAEHRHRQTAEPLGRAKESAVAPKTYHGLDIGVRTIHGFPARLHFNAVFGEIAEETAVKPE